MDGDLETADAPAPHDIESQVIEIMKWRPTLRWDEALKLMLEEPEP